MLDAALTDAWLRTAKRADVRKALRDPDRFRAEVLPELRARGVPAGTAVAPAAVFVTKEPLSIRFST